MKLKDMTKLVEGLNRTNSILNLSNRYYIYLYDNTSNEYRIYEKIDIEKLQYIPDIMTFILSNDFKYNDYYKIYELYVNEQLTITLKIMEY